MENIQQWLEMEDLINADFNRRTWIPLRQFERVEKGDFYQNGFVKEFSGYIAVMFPKDYIKKPLAIEWSSVSHHGFKPCIESDGYHETGEYYDFHDLTGRYLVYTQAFETGDRRIWYLDPNLELGLELKREKDVWVRPKDNYEEVVRLKRDANGDPISMEIKTKYIKDYLCFRNCELLIVQYHSRDIVMEKKVEFWEGKDLLNEGKHYIWQGFIGEIGRNGMPAGRNVAIFRSGFKSIDNKNDIPDFDWRDEEKTYSNHEIHEVESFGLFQHNGELWINNQVDPGNKSYILRGDEEESYVKFIYDVDGSEAKYPGYSGGIRWLWFKPEIVNSLLDKRGATFGWYTGNTGFIGNLDYQSVHFGMNSLGLLCVLSKDIEELPNEMQLIWRSHNCIPDGRVSEELMMSQMQAKPADTVAPEIKIWYVMGALQDKFEMKYGKSLFLGLPDKEKVIKSVHRFVALNEEGLFKLAKLLYRELIERMSLETLKSLTSDLDSKKDSPKRELKRIEHLINNLGFDGSSIIAPLFAVNELRQGDAHRGVTDKEKQFEILGLNEDYPWIINGTIMIDRVAFSLYQIYESLE